MSIRYDSLTDRELLVILATKMESLEAVMIGHIPQDCISAQEKIRTLETEVSEIKIDLEKKATREELKSVGESTTWAFRIAAAAILAGLFDLGRWLITSIIGSKGQ